MKFINFGGKGIDKDGFQYLNKERTVRQKVYENYLGRGQAIVTEFLENGEWKVGPYEYRDGIHSDEFDASAGSFNLSNIHTFSSGAQNVFIKNNKDNKKFFPVWQNYEGNSATMRVYGEDQIVKTGDLSNTGETVIDFLDENPSGSTWKVEVEITEELIQGYKIEGWLSGVPNGKADWISKDKSPKQPGLYTIIYDTPNEINSSDNWYTRVTNIATGELVKVRPITTDSSIPYLKTWTKPYEDKPVAIDNGLEGNSETKTVAGFRNTTRTGYETICSLGDIKIEGSMTMIRLVTNSGTRTQVNWSKIDIAPNTSSTGSGYTTSTFTFSPGDIGTVRHFTAGIQGVNRGFIHLMIRTVGSSQLQTSAMITLY